MSTWTHVSGVIRINDLSFITHDKRNTSKTVEKIIGPMCLFDKWNKNTKLPTGSEGSIEYKVIQNKNESSIARFTVVFWGDLRDYDDLDEIQQWFIQLKKDIEDDKHVMLYRDAVLKAYVECTNESLVITLDDNMNWRKQNDKVKN